MGYARAGEHARCVVHLCKSQQLCKVFETPEKWRGSGLVRLVEDYTEAHFVRAITIEELASVASVRVRTIFAHLRRTRGCTPLQFLGWVRLQTAQAMFQEPEVHTSVTDVALHCGFTDLGHFARDYRQMFGEEPSQTIASAKRRGQGFMSSKA